MQASTRTILATAAALVGFAANSVLCRMALGAHAIDAWSFTAIRLTSGAVALFVLARFAATKTADRDGGSLASAAALFGYAAAFSFAYLRLGAGVGALVLFAAVQATMIGWSLRRGEPPSAIEWCGLALAFGGLVVLTWPGAVAPDPIGVVSMTAAGVAWGVYSLRGRSVRSPLAATADNFTRAVPLSLGVLALRVLFAPSSAHVSTRGALLAVASGAFASGVGYSLWYLALPKLTTARAALVQLCVPVIAALLGIAWLGERMSVRLAVSGAMILGGVGAAVSAKKRALPALARARH